MFVKKGFRILLILPQGPIHRCDSKSYKKALRYAPLSLPTVAGLIPQELEAEVRYIDEGVRVLDVDTLEADVVGISVMTGTATRAYRIADIFRRKGSTVVLGGIHVTLMPREAQAHGDSIVVGMAEECWPRLLRDYARGELQPVYRESPDFEYKNVPPARRDLIEADKYVTANTIHAVRGCHNSCDFCAIAAACGRKMHHRPIAEVIAEIETLPGKKVLFLDPSPMENVDYAKALYRAMIPLRKWWVGCASTKIAKDPELMDLAAQSGCKGLLVGLESVAQGTIDSLNKRFNHVSKYRTFIRHLHERGIGIQGCFIFGTDSDDKDVFKRTVDFVYQTNIDLPQFSIYTPFPGTEAFRRMVAQRRIVEWDWTLYDAEHVVFEPARMTRPELFAGLKYAWKEAYAYRSIFKRLMGSRCLLEFLIPANLGYHHYAKRLKLFTDEAMKETNATVASERFPHERNPAVAPQEVGLLD